ncbi:hypothetical protein ASG29_01420 [Sphingomonas sp. Leaf412]|nr:hypothetical protein ASG29_01420 [Sphingomonas sp. Leaf412]
MLLPLTALLAAAPAAGARDRDRGPGIAGERQGDTTVYRVAGFDRLAVGGPASSDVRVGPAWSLRIDGPPEAVARLRVVVERGRLEIGPRANDARADRAEVDADRRVRIAVTMPRLSDVALGGSGRMTVDRVTGDRFAAALGGSGALSIGRLAVGDATVSIGGSGQVSTAGEVRTLTLNLGGSGDLIAPDLRAGSATVSAAGSGSVRAQVDGEARVSLVGSASVDLGPRARCRTTRMGSGTVRCGG